jgi:hypothetical protein
MSRLKPLELLTFFRGQATDGHGADERDVASACSELGGDGRGYLKRAFDAAVLGVVLINTRLHNRMSRPGVAEVKVVQSVASVGGNPSLVVGRGAGALGFAEDRLDSSGTIKVRA